MSIGSPCGADTHAVAESMGPGTEKGRSALGGRGGLRCLSWRGAAGLIPGLGGMAPWGSQGGGCPWAFADKHSPALTGQAFRVLPGV